MKPWMRRSVGVAAGLLLIGTVLVIVQASPATTYDLGDGSVWIVDAGARIGRVNGHVPEVDFVDERDDAGLDVVQDGRHVYVVTGDGSTSVAQLDPTDPSAEMAEPVTLESEAEVQAGGGVVAAGEGESGKVFRLGSGGELDSAVVGDPAFTVGPEGAFAVGMTGTVAGVDPQSGKLYTLRADATEATTSDVETSAADQLTMLGETVVVLDRAAAELHTNDGKTIDVGSLGDDAQLQLPGMPSGAVLVATSQGLFEVPLDGDDPVSLATAAGVPVRPATVGDCAVAAWSGSGAEMVAACEGEGEDVLREPIEGGSVVVRGGAPTALVNDTESGDAWVLIDGVIRKVAWPQDQVQESGVTSEQEFQPATENVKPVAKDDELFMRAGQVTTLDVLANDSDENLDLLSIDPESLPDVDGVGVTLAEGGRALQAEPSADGGPAPGGLFSFSYAATDGSEASDPAEVSVTVIEASAEGSAPEKREGAVLPKPTVEAGKSVYIEVASLFWDAEGDPFGLESVRVPDPLRGMVTFDRGAGGFTFVAPADPGPAVVEFAVRDGYHPSPSKTESITVQVVAAGSQVAPDPSDDWVVTTVGVATVVEPLANDVDANGDSLTLAEDGLEPLTDGAPDLVVDATRRSYSFTPDTAGLFRVRYRASDGEDGHDAPAVIVINVLAGDAEAATRPDPVPDILLVPAGGHATVDLLANDVSPTARILAVTDLRAVSAPDDSGLLVGVGADMRIAVADAATTAVADHATYTYTVSDGYEDAQGLLDVWVVSPEGADRPPVGREVSAKVHAGDVLTVPLADLATDPDGDELMLELVEPVPDGVYLGDDSVRVEAPAESTTIEVRVAVSDRAGHTASAGVRAEVVESDSNSAPVMPDLVARVRVGASVSVPIQRFGVDPDGDSVRLLNVDPPLAGRATADIANQAVVFEASDGLASTTLDVTYGVVDSRGGLAEGRIRVSVHVADPHAPIALTDHVEVAKGRTVAVDPLANDLDLDGDPLTFSLQDLDEGAASAFATDEANTRVLVTGTGATEVGHYQLSDGSSTATGSIIAIVGDEDLLLPPRARDDFAGVPRSDIVEVDLSINDEDPDGGPECALEWGLIDAPEGVEHDGKSPKVRVPAKREAQSILYTLTDCDGLKSTGVLWIEARPRNLGPQPTGKVLELRADETPKLELSDYVSDPNGDPVALVKADQPPSALGTVTRDSATSFTFTPENKEKATRGQIGLLVVDKPANGKPIETVVAVDVEISPRKPVPPEWGPCFYDPTWDPAAPYTMRLDECATDPDHTDMRFDASPAADHPEVADLVTIKVAAGTLTVTKQPGVPIEAGDRLPLLLSVEDGHTTEPVTKALTITVRDSEAAVVVPSPDTLMVEKGDSGTLDVLENDVGSSDSVELVATEASGEARMSDGTSIGTWNLTEDGTFRFSATALGAAVVPYEVADTLSGDRTRSSTVAVRVGTFPDPPQIVRGEAGDEFLRIAFNDGFDGNDPISGYEVEGFPGAVCGRGTCTIDGGAGVTNGTNYELRVRAVNSIGAGAWSNPISLRPDLKPNPVENLTAHEEQRSIRFTWDAPEGNRGTAANRYLVEIGGEQHRVDGLEWRQDAPPGVAVTATVVAVNGPADDEKFSEKVSVSGVPYDVPIISNPTATAGNRQIYVRFDVNGNGADVTAISVEADNCGRQPPAAGGENPVEVTLTCTGKFGEGRTVSISVTNSKNLTTTAEVEAGAPWAVPEFDDPSVTATAGLEKLELKLPEARAGTPEVVQWQFKEGGVTWRDLPRGNVVVVSVIPWIPTRLQVRACGRKPVSDVDESCVEMTSNEATAWGSPSEPVAWAAWDDETLTTATLTYIWDPVGTTGTWEMELSHTDPDGIFGATDSDSWSVTPSSTESTRSMSPIGTDTVWVRVRDTSRDLYSDWVPVWIDPPPG